MRTVSLTCGGRRRTVRVANNDVKPDGHGGHVLTKAGRSHRSKICSTPAKNHCTSHGGRPCQSHHRRPSHHKSASHKRSGSHHHKKKSTGFFAWI